MNVSLQNTDKVSAVLTVNMVKADYEENVAKSLKTIRKDAQMRGFRKGMVPMGIIKKMYEKSAMADEVNKLLGESISKYLEDNHVDIMGEPLPSENQKQIDFDTMEDFEFVFDLALAPEINIEMGKDDHVVYYDVTVTDEMVDSQCKMFTQRNGKYETVEAYEDNDMLKGTLTELDAEGNVKEGGLVVEDTPMMPSYFTNDEQKAKFNGAKVGDVITFNPSAAWDGNAVRVASALKIEKDAAENMKSDFTFQVNEVTRFVPGELTQEIFDQVFGEGAVKTEEEFKAKIRETIEAQFSANSDFRFLTDARKVIMDKVGKLEFSEPLMKRLMKANNPDKDDKFIDENYDKSIEELTWVLVRNKLVKDYGIKIDHEEIVDAAESATRAQFAQYGMMSIPDDVVNKYATEMLGRREAVENLAARVMDNKLTDCLKEKVTSDHQTISAADFNKLFE